MKFSNKHKRYSNDEGVIDIYSRGLYVTNMGYI